MSWKASCRACSHSSVQSVMLPPRRLWSPAPIVPTIDRDLTVIPRTIPMFLAIRYPGSSLAEVMKLFGINESSFFSSSQSRVPSPESRLRSQQLPRLQLLQQAVYFLLLLHRREAGVHVVGGHLRPGLAHRLGAGD